ncbi:MAG: wax ester/triacylglycerol synthase family O-acyltransferase [Moraxella sp.]|nr:wax ester/triacylglycerol synthase family O-acyltransferase [Moraxella sp.]
MYKSDRLEPLSLTDHVFLLLETKKNPMHIAVLCFFELPKNCDPKTFYQKFRTAHEVDLPPVAPFNKKLHKKLFWKKVDRIDRSRHYFTTRLADGSKKTLLTYISKQHACPLDKDHPLWQLHFIEGLDPKDENSPEQLAIYLKMHHSLIDGVGGMRLLERLLFATPDELLDKPLWTKVTTKPKHLHSDKHTKHSQARKSTTLKTLTAVSFALKKRFTERHFEGFTSSFDAPKSPLNQRIDSSRAFYIHALKKERFIKLAHAFSTPDRPITTNDVLLTVMAGALRQYLSHKNTLPKKPLIGFVPVSLRQDDSMAGNQLSFLLINLATHEPNPKRRLDIIHQSSQDGKSRFNAMHHAQEIIAYSLAIYGAAGLNLATGLLPKKQAFNLIISNTPGSKDIRYLNGATLTGVYPASVLLDGQALNLTLANHQNTFDIGILACENTLPNIETLGEFMTQALEELEQLALSHQHP